jgi:Fur family transcriptional regulator, ferric uptake regulator
LKQTRKMRNTKPRRVILEELKKVTTHPTADEVYNMVRERLPRVSLGTVYRNLEMMSESGVILKLEIAGTQRRYDGTTDNHYHVRCTMCGKVDDLPIKPLSGIEREVREVSAYEISGHRLEFKGLCPGCKSRGKGRATAS